MWKPVIGHPGYKVSDDGQVFGIKRGKVLKPFGERYQMVELHQKGRTVHSLVWEAFNGVVPEGLEIDHIDNNRDNNNLTNLRLLTHSQNLTEYHKRFGNRGSVYPNGKGYAVRVGLDKTCHYLGTFKTRAQADQAILDFDMKNSNIMKGGLT